MVPPTTPHSPATVPSDDSPSGVSKLGTHAGGEWKGAREYSPPSLPKGGITECFIPGSFRVWVAVGRWVCRG